MPRSKTPSTSRRRNAPRLALVRSPRRAGKAAASARTGASRGAAAPKLRLVGGTRTKPAAKVAVAKAAVAKSAAKQAPKSAARAGALAKAQAKAKAARSAPAPAPVRTAVPVATGASKRPRPDVPVRADGRVARDRLLERYTPLIKYVVERLSVGLPRNVDHEDLMSAGVLGLLDAYDKFDSGKGTKFETYAVWRIKGAVLDQLRSLDWASRSVRRKAREVEASMRRLDHRLGRAATDEEIAREARMPLSDYHRLMDQVRGAVLLSLDDARQPEEGDALGMAELIEDPDTPDMLAHIEEEETRRILLDTLNRLPEQERIVVALYYYEHMTLREIGATLGISESRVSQVHSRAVQRLRGRVRRVLAA